MRKIVLLAVFVAAAAGVEAGSRQFAPETAAADPAVAVIVPAMVNCPSVVGNGVHTERTYCDVPIGNDATQGIIVELPPHAGPVTLLFDLHNRHLYSAEQVRAKKGYHRYTAGIGVLTLDNHLISRAAILSEFRVEADLFDRISAGNGLTTLKAVAPTGIESVAITIPEMEQSVSILGEKLRVEHVDGTDNFTTPGRPIALISNVRVEYVPAAARTSAR